MEYIFVFKDNVNLVYVFFFNKILANISSGAALKLDE